MGGPRIRPASPPASRSRLSARWSAPFSARLAGGRNAPLHPAPVLSSGLTCVAPLAISLLLAACAGPATLSAPPAPADGLIEYRETSPQPGLLGKGSRPLNVAFFTGKDELVESHDAFQAASGRLPGSMAESGISPRSLQDVFTAQAGGARRALSAERFGELWTRLGAAGFFGMPRDAAGAPPAAAPYFRVKADGKEWIVARPEVRLPHEVSPSDTERLRAWSERDPAFQAFESWKRSKLVFFDFLNER